MRGQCLCGQVAFEIEGDRFNLYQCHCSLCRRQGGTLSNAATIVPADRFRWVRGVESISSWRKESGFRSDFCSCCGAPVPNALVDGQYVWVPAGLLENGGSLEVVAQLHVASRPVWDDLPLRGVCFETMPTLSDLIARLQPARA